MRKFILDKFKSCNFIDAEQFNIKQKIYHLKKYDKPNYDVGSSYLVKVSKELVNNSDDVLCTNWNSGKVIPAEYLTIYVSKVASGMLRVDALVYDNNLKIDTSIMWSGYLPIKYLEQIRKIA